MKNIWYRLCHIPNYMCLLHQITHGEVNWKYNFFRAKIVNDSDSLHTSTKRRIAHLKKYYT